MAVSEFILPVRKVQMDGGDFIVTCPHCHKIIGIERPFLGEQFQHQIRGNVGCGGWFEVTSNARVEGL